MKIDIHNYPHLVQVATQRLKVDSRVSEKNKHSILAFVDSIVADGISRPRVIKYLDALRKWAIWLNKDFDTVEREDIAAIVTKLQLNGDYSPWTRQIFKCVIKRFFKWLKKTDEFPAEVKWISLRISKSEQRLPGEGELLTEEEVKKLLDVTDHPRDKAFISVLWESGCRIGEIGSLCICNVIVDDKGVILTVTGKTGSRKIRLVSSTESLLTWLKNHPLRIAPYSPLWVNVGNTNRNKAMEYRNIANTIRHYFQKAGIKKRCNPHIFRHSRATFLANHLTEFQMNQYFGWVQGSDMPSTYVHMSGREVDEAILALNGIVPAREQKKESPLTPKKCPRCFFINSFDSSYCSRCACVLDMKLILEIEEKTQKENDVKELANKLLNALTKNPSALKLLVEQMQI